MEKMMKNDEKPERKKAEVTRREFIKTTAGVAAGVTAGTGVFLGGIAPAFAKKKIKLTYWSRDYNQKEAKQYAAEFMKMHPEYNIKVEGLPWTGMYEKINTALMAGKSADLLSCALQWIGAFGELGFLHPLDKQWERDIPKTDRDDYFPAGVSYCTYKNKLYGTPWRVDGNMLIWSLDAFKEAGLDPSKGPETWEDIVEYGQKLIVSDTSGKVKQYGVCLTGKPAANIMNWFMIPLIWSLGGDFTDKAVKKSRMDEKPVIEAFKYGAELRNKYNIANPPAFSYAWSDISPVLAKRATAILFGHQANFKIIWKVTPGMKLGAAPYPKGPAGRFSQANGWSHAIPTTANVEDVWPFLVYLQDPMRQAVLTVGAPGRKAGLAHQKYDVFKKDPLLEYAAGSGADTAKAGTLEMHPLGPKIYEEIGRTFAKAWEGKMKPENAALEAHKRVNEIIKSS